MQMRIGYVTPNSWGVDDPHEVVELAVAAEEAGVDSVWVSHHVLHAGFVAERLGDRPYHDPLVMLTAFATATERVRLGTSVLVLPYVHPVSTAKTLATIDHLSRGRLEVGVGVGGLRVEHDRVGLVPFEQRGRYSDEFLEVLELLWSGTPSTFAGEHFAFEGAEAHPGPVRPEGMPVVVGGASDAALRRTARFGAAWQGVGQTPAEAAGVRDRLAPVLEAAGRDPAGVPLQVRLHLGPDELAAADWVDRIPDYTDAGVGELLIAPQTGERAVHTRFLDWVRDRD